LILVQTGLQVTISSCHCSITKNIDYKVRAVNSRSHQSTNKQKIMKILFQLIFVFLLIPGLSFGQNKIKSFSNVYVPANGFMSLFGDYEFSGDAADGQMVTNRSSNKGVVNFVAESKWMGDASNQFIDGYVCVHHDKPFTLPVGNKGVYAPIATSGADKTVAAFYRDNPLQLEENISSDISRVSNFGYWDVSSPNDSRITLAYSSEFDVNDIETLTIIGLVGNQWEVVSSSVDEYKLNIMSSNGVFDGKSTTKSGSITTNEAINPSDYDALAIGSIGNTALIADVNFSVFPNPSLTGNDINIEYELPKNGSLKLFNSANQIIYSQSMNGGVGEMTLDRLNLHEGTYFVTFTDEQGLIKSKKLIVVSK
jgi:hypothetical protein